MVRGASGRSNRTPGSLSAGPKPKGGTGSRPASCSWLSCGQRGLMLPLPSVGSCADASWKTCGNVIWQADRDSARSLLHPKRYPLDLDTCKGARRLRARKAAARGTQRARADVQALICCLQRRAEPGGSLLRLER
jgi:hypothetical protein